MAELEHDRLSQEMELAEAYAESRAPRTTTGLPQVPWDTDQLAMPTAQAILAGFVKATGVEPAEGLTEPLASLALVSSITQIIAGEWEGRLYEQLKNTVGEWVNTMNRRELLRLLRRVAATFAASAVALPRRVADGHPFTPRVVSEATPGTDIYPIEHLQQMKKVLMDNDKIFGANSVIWSVREQISNLQQLRHSYRGGAGRSSCKFKPSSVTCADGSIKTPVIIARLLTGLGARLNGRTCATIGMRWRLFLGNLRIRRFP